MAVKLRLMRMGKRKHPTYRVVAADSRSPRDGRFIELIGRYDPHPHPSLVEIDNERALHWLKVGAQPTAAVRKLLQISGAWGQFQVHRGEVHVVGEAAPPPEKDRKSKKARAREAADEAPADEAPADEAPADETAADETAADETAADETPADEAPADEAPVDEAGTDAQARVAAEPEAEESTTRAADEPAGDEAAAAAETADEPTAEEES
jgi:small subunit ribosomal protein S16